MIREIVPVVCLFMFLSSTSFAAKTTYIVTNHRFNYVKTKEIKGGEIEARQMTHPVTLDEQGVRSALASLNLARSYVIKKEVDTQRIFEESAVNFLAPAFVRAFSEAKPNEEVVFSYLAKNPILILRNDRLTIGRAWIHNDELHIKFDKLYAKITGDVDKRGNEDRAASRAQGLRIKLDIGEGQMYGINDPEEIVLNLHYNYAKKPEAKETAPEPTETTMAGEVVAPEPDPAAFAKNVKESKKGKLAKGSSDTGAANSAAVPAPEPTMEERLKKLESLKRQGLIDKKEYEEKKKEILKEL